mmetsp:Transcript_27065/g.88462  ORF Transcript_27065/g.88462 Transcript_27065/m.88462 type:complete len:272 (+) Transcript_27065:10-825(+)
MCRRNEKPYPCRVTFLRRHTRLEILRPREEAANSKRERGAPLAANPAREGDARAASAVRQHFVQHAPRVEEDEPTADGQDLHTLAAARAHLVLVGRVEVEHELAARRARRECACVVEVQQRRHLPRGGARLFERAERPARDDRQRQSIAVRHVPDRRAVAASLSSFGRRIARELARQRHAERHLVPCRIKAVPAAWSRREATTRRVARRAGELRRDTSQPAQCGGEPWPRRALAEPVLEEPRHRIGADMLAALIRTGPPPGGVVGRAKPVE